MAYVWQVGADLSMGSLIKNPGGTIVTGGGYVAGRSELVAAAQARLTAPGVGLDAGCVPGDTLRLMMQGSLHCHIKKHNRLQHKSVVNNNNGASLAVQHKIRRRVFCKEQLQAE